MLRVADIVVVGSLASDVRCIGCNRSLRGCSILGYPHKGGELVNGVRMWLYVECPGCAYQNSLRKLGVSLHDVSGCGESLRGVASST